jgi:hypothetical protein
MQHQLGFKKYVVIILTCLLVNALIWGLGFDSFQVLAQRVGGINVPIPTLWVKIRAVWAAFVYIVLLGYWLAYVLPAITVHLLASYFKKRKYSQDLIVFSVFVWALAGVGLGSLSGNPTNEGWLTWLLISHWPLVTTYAIIGLVYGSMYWYWYIDQR